MFRGTPIHSAPVAPEVARRHIVTNRPAVDCYGLGCIAHDLAHINTGVDEAAAADADDAYHSGITSCLTTVGQNANPVVLIIKRASCVLLTCCDRVHPLTASRCFSSPHPCWAVMDYAPCIAPSVPEPLAALLRALLAVDPAERPTAGEARRSLESMAADSVSWPGGAAAAGLTPRAAHLVPGGAALLSVGE